MRFLCKEQRGLFERPMMTADAKNTFLNVSFSKLVSLESVFWSNLDDIFNMRMLEG
jgi:hypothetical protein